MLGTSNRKRPEPAPRPEEELRLEKMYNQAKNDYAEYLHKKAKLDVINKIS